MRFMQTESVLRIKNRSRPAKNRFPVALDGIMCNELNSNLSHGYQLISKHILI